MKWMTWIPVVLLLTACGFTNTQVIEYQQVVVPPYEELTVVDYVPVDVTNTTVEFY